MLIRHVCSGWILLPYAPEPPAGAHGGPTLLSGRARVVRGVRRGRAQGVGHAGEQVETRSLYYSFSHSLFSLSLYSLSHSILSHTLFSLTLSLSHSFSLTLFLSHTLFSLTLYSLSLSFSLTLFLSHTPCDSPYVKSPRATPPPPPPPPPRPPPHTPIHDRILQSDHVGAGAPGERTGALVPRASAHAP